MKRIGKSLALLALCGVFAFPAYGGTWRTEGNFWRYQDDSGADVRGQWVSDAGNWYYLDARGNMCTGWLKLDDDWYYLDDSGRMAVGNTVINGAEYTFLSDGRLKRGPEAAAEPGVSLAPYVTARMCEADYWISKYPSAYERLRSAQEIREINRRISETPETMVRDLSALPETFNGRAMADSMAAEEMPAGLYLNGEPVPESYYEAIRTNIRNAAVSENMGLRYGFVVNRTVMRGYPCDDFLSDTASDPEWDEIASTAVLVNEPVVVYFFSGDGRYAYIRSNVCPGWVPAADIAVCSGKAEWEDARNMTRFLVVTGDKIYLETSPAYPEVSQKMLTMGTVLELADGNWQDGELNLRASWNNYVVKLPARNADGSFSQQLALIPAGRDVNVGYLPLTVSGILEQAFKALGDRYGWGGSLDARDCSAFAREVYQCFGLEIARNTTWQAVMPTEITDLSAKSSAEKEEFLKTLTPGAILQIPGHEMIYLGESGGRFYTINVVSRIVNPLQAEGDSTTSLIRSVIVNDLSTRRANGNTWLDELTRAIVVWR